MSQQPKQPRRLTAVLNDPSAEWSEIIYAAKARAKTQGGGAVTNHALVKSLLAAEQPMDNNSTESSDDEGQAAKDDSARSGSGDDKLMPLGNINRRASISSQSSSRRSLFRHEALRRQSIRRRASLESIGKHSSSSSRSRSSRRSTFSGRSITVTPTFNCSTNSINSVNVMDFGVSNRALSAALDESRRSFSSLDDDVLDELDEELYGDGREGRGGSRRGLLLSWRKNDSSRSLRSIHNCEFNEQPTRSEGDLDDYQDSCGFMDWPSVADGANDTIQEEQDNPIKTEEDWNIEDYEQNIDDTVRRRPSQRNFLSQSLTKTLRVFDRSPSMESSFSTPRLGSSFSSQEGITDLIKQKLLNTKKELAAEVEENNDRKKPNPFSFTSALRRSSSDADETAKPQEAIWVRESDDDPGVGEQYRNIYAATAAKSQQTQRKSNLFSYF